MVGRDLAEITLEGCDSNQSPGEMGVVTQGGHVAKREGLIWGQNIGGMTQREHKGRVVQQGRGLKVLNQKFELPGDQKLVETVLVVNWQMSQPKKLYVFVKVQGQRLLAVVDTACYFNLINEDVVRYFREGVTVQPCSIELRGAGNSSLHVLGRVMLRMEFGNVTSEVSFIVCRGFQLDILIGLKLLQEMGGKVDLDKLCLSSEKLGNIDLILETSKGKAFNLCAEEEVTLSPCEKVRVKLKEKGGEWSQGRGNAESVLMVSQLDDMSLQTPWCTVIKGRTTVEVRNISQVEQVIGVGDMLVHCFPVIEINPSFHEKDPDPEFWDKDRVKLLLETVVCGEENEPEGKRAAEKLVEKFADIFLLHDTERREVPYFRVRINLVNDIPVTCKPRLTPIHYREMVTNELKRLLEGGIIQRSESVWSSPALWIPKKDGNIRVILDYRKLNIRLQQEACLLPDIRETLSRWGGMKFFSVVDLSSSYYQLELAEECRHLTAFQVDGVKYAWRKMPLGLQASPAHLSHAMSEVVKDINPKYLKIYMDDAIIGGETEEVMLGIL